MKKWHISETIAVVKKLQMALDRTMRKGLSNIKVIIIIGNGKVNAILKLLDCVKFNAFNMWLD